MGDSGAAGLDPDEGVPRGAHRGRRPQLPRQEPPASPHPRAPRPQRKRNQTRTTDGGHRKGHRRRKD